MNELDNKDELIDLNNDESEETEGNKLKSRVMIDKVISGVKKTYIALLTLNILGFVFVTMLILFAIFHVSNDILTNSDVVKNTYYNYIEDMNEEDSNYIVDNYFSERLTYIMKDSNETMDNTIRQLNELDVDISGKVLKVVETEVYYFLEVEEWLGNYEETVSNALYVFVKEDGEWKIDTIKGLDK